MPRSLLVAMAAATGILATLGATALLTNAVDQLPTPIGVESVSADNERWLALINRLDVLEAKVAALSRQSGSEPAIVTKPFDARADPTTSGVTGQGSFLDPQGALEALREAVATRSGGGELSRLIVDATAPEILDDILALIRDRSQPALLRETLLVIIGTPRFRGREDVAATLLAVIASDEHPGVLGAAIKAFGQIGDAVLARRLIPCIATLTPSELRNHAVQVLVSLADLDANRVLAQLFVICRDDALRTTVLGVLRQDDIDAALDAYHRVVGQSQPVRLFGAKRVGSFRDERFLAFVESWITQETDSEVLLALGAAKTAQRSNPSWSAMQAVGPPDTANPSKDSPTAWAPAAADAGMEWIELTYDPPLRASEVRIHEVLAAGAVVSVSTRDMTGAKVVLWEGSDPLRKPGVLSVTFPVTSFPLRTLRVELDTRRSKGWNEIDAVELVGPNGRSWARSAVASSSYSDRQHSEAYILSGLNDQLDFTLRGR